MQHFSSFSAGKYNHERKRGGEGGGRGEGRGGSGKNPHNN